MEIVNSLKGQALTCQTGDPAAAASWKTRYEESQEKAQRVEN